MNDEHENFQTENLLGLIEKYAPDFFYIADFSAGKFLFVSDSITSFLGYSFQDFYKENGVQFILSLIHPHDLQLNRALFRRFKHSEFTNKTSFINIEYRVKNSKGDYVWIRSKDYIVDFTEKKRIKLTFGMARYINEPKEKDVFICKDLNFKKVAKEAYLKYSERKKNIEKISCRELQIAGHIINGLSSKIIASKLHISPETVETHRRNILKKLGVKNTAQSIDILYKYKLLGGLLATGIL